MANASSSNGEPSKKEACAKFTRGKDSSVDGSRRVEEVEVEVGIEQPNRASKQRRRFRQSRIKLFERSNGNLLNPQFDSEVLERFLRKCYFPQARRLIRNTLFFVAVASFCWAVYFGLMQVENPTSQWYYFVGGALLSLIVMITLLLFSCSQCFEKYSKHTSYILAAILVILIQLPFVLEDSDISTVGTFFGVVEILILLYSFLPLSLIAAAGFGVFLSISYEVFTALRHPRMQEPDYIICKILLHVIIHVFGVFIFIMLNTRTRSNFSKIGQSVSAQRDLMVEREIKEKMIHSLMPPVVAKSVMATHPSKDEGDDDDDNDAEKKKRRKTKHVKGEIIFRKFQMDEMKDVSILFADIVGFTKMSSNKTAERLVGLLNDLFGRFDQLCNASGCEKISTLGDCYYCVSGCPNPCPDHAKCCVEMGLSMCIAIRAFDEDHNEEVNMRVGVHTGTVLCGIVGTVRFKFDVWSNDVTLANIMESTGEPGKVHISESTRDFLVDEYEMVEGQEVPDMRGRKELIEHYDPKQSSFTIKHKEELRNIKTYFIIGRKPGRTGIPGLEELADKRPEHLHKKSENQVEANNSAATEVENGTSAAVTADLFSQRIPDIMADDETPRTATDDPESGVDSTLLKPSRTESVAEDQDKLLVSLIEKENEKNEVFVKSSLNKVILTFDQEMENMYRHEFKDSHMFEENMLSSPRYQMVVDAIIALVSFILLAVCCHVMFDLARTPGLIVVTVVGLIVEVLVFLDALSNICCLKRKKSACPTLMNITLTWFFRNALGVIVASIPVLLVYISMSCDLVVSNGWHDRMYCFFVAVALVQFCNYCMLRSFAKTIAAILVGSVLVILHFVKFCTFESSDQAASPDDGNATVGNAGANVMYSTNLTMNNSQESFLDNYLFSGESLLRFEIIVNVLLLLLLISILNYEFENLYRLSFNASIKAQRDKENMQLNKDQADWLLHNIIPAHLAELFKTNKSYSHNHQDVGVIFATITNFNEFYDEMYAGGREYLRVLNELVSDYEVRLSEPRFKDVEKIKTISSSFMAAAGLNEESRAKNRHEHSHLFALMEFAMELQEVVKRFNESIFNFEFTLNIGYNFGPVTAGVIGTTKLHYDIWGDTVNIASRMYSTGEANRIQVPQATVESLSEMFEFSYRDEIFVKGKGMMKTYLLERKKSGVQWEWETKTGFDGSEAVGI